MEYYTNKRGYQEARFYYRFSRFEEPDYEEIILKECNPNENKIKVLGRCKLKTAKLVYGKQNVAIAYKDGKNLIVILEEKEK